MDDSPQLTALSLELHPLFLVLTGGKPFLGGFATLRDLLFFKGQSRRSVKKVLCRFFGKIPQI